MNGKKIISLALFLVACGTACLVMDKSAAKPVAHIPNPPSVEQVQQWAKPPTNVQLTLLTNEPDVYQLQETMGKDGKVIWAREYRCIKGRSQDSYVIAIFEPGTLFGTNRAGLVDFSKQMANNTNGYLEPMKTYVRPRTLSSGRQSYGGMNGFDPIRFSFQTQFDLLVINSFESGENYPPEEKIEVPNFENFFRLFDEVDGFLNSQ